MALCQRLFGTDNIIIFVWKISCTHKCPSLFCGHGKIWSLIFGKLPSLWVAQFQANKTQMHICKPYQHWALNKQIHSGEFKSTLVTETALPGSVWTNSTVEARAMYTSNLDVAKEQQSYTRTKRLQKTGQNPSCVLLLSVNGEDEVIIHQFLESTCAFLE